MNAIRPSVRLREWSRTESARTLGLRACPTVRPCTAGHGRKGGGDFAVRPCPLLKGRTDSQACEGAASTTNNTAKPPRLPAYLCDDGAQVRVWCRFCDCWHYHGAGVLGHRAAHCHSDSPYRETGHVLVWPPEEAGSGHLRTPKRAKGVKSRPSGAPSSASYAATACNDRRFRVLPCASRAVMRGDLGDHLQACGSTVTAPTGTGRGHQARDIAAQSVRWHRPPLPSHGSPPRRSG